jgi:hypothetical protein
VLARVAQVVEDALNARQVGVARVGGWSVHADEQQPSVLEHLRHVGGEVQPLGVLGDQLGQARLVDRHLAAAQRVDLGGHDVARPDLVPELREAGGRDEANPANADDADRFLLFRHGASRLQSAHSR